MPLSLVAIVLGVMWFPRSDFRRAPEVAPGCKAQRGEGLLSLDPLVALYVQDGEGKTAFEDGLFAVPTSLLSAWAANWAGHCVYRYGRKIVIWGPTLTLLGTGASIGVVLLHEAMGFSV